MGHLSSDITTAGLLHVLGGDGYSRCQCRVHGREVEADDDLDQPEGKYSHECCQCIFAVLREKLKWHGEISFLFLLFFSLFFPFSFLSSHLFSCQYQVLLTSKKGPPGGRALVNGPGNLKVTMAVPGKDVFVLKVKFRPPSACRTAVLGLPGRDRGTVRQPANRSDGPTQTLFTPRNKG